MPVNTQTAPVSVTGQPFLEPTLSAQGLIDQAKMRRSGIHRTGDVGCTTVAANDPSSPIQKITAVAPYTDPNGLAQQEALRRTVDSPVA